MSEQRKKLPALWIMQDVKMASFFGFWSFGSWVTPKLPEPRLSLGEAPLRSQDCGNRNLESPLLLFWDLCLEERSPVYARAACPLPCPSWVPWAALPGAPEIESVATDAAASYPGARLWEGEAGNWCHWKLQLQKRNSLLSWRECFQIVSWGLQREIV